MITPFSAFVKGKWGQDRCTSGGWQSFLQGPLQASGEGSQLPKSRTPKFI